MLGRRAYDLMYRLWAPWSNADRWEIRRLVDGGPCDPKRLRPADAEAPRAIDLGCGAGGVTLALAVRGFRSVGVDFSPVAIRKARVSAAAAGLGPDRVRFVEADLTAVAIPGVAGPFDLHVDYGTLDDLPSAVRPRMADLVTSLARPGSRFFLFAFYGRRRDLPRFSFTGPSRMAPGLEPGDVEDLFGAAWDVEQVPREGDRFLATFLLTRRA